MSVEFRSKSVGQHGANIFYTEFSVLWNSIFKTYRLGSFYFVRKDDNPVTIAECQLIWKNTYSGKRYASCKLYFNPEDADDEDWDENMEHFGKNEVIEADRQVVIECCDFPSWECESNLWDKNVGEIAFHGIPREYIRQLTKKESMVSEFGAEEMDIKIISYPEYCRLQTCYKMINIGMPMTFKLFIARGGVQVKNLNTLILFSRWRFSQPGVDDFSLTRNITVPVFKGRPRKKKRKEFMILKKQKEKKLRKEMKKWNLGTSAKRKYTKRNTVEKPLQEIHSSANAAASRILNKYKKKNERTTEVCFKTEDIGKTEKKYMVPKGRKATDGRLKINKLKKAHLNTIQEGKSDDADEISDEVEEEDLNKKDMKSEEDSNEKDDMKSTKSVVIVEPEEKEKEKGKSNGSVKTESEMPQASEMSVDLPRDEFIKDLYAFMDARKNPIIKVPSMGRAQVDLYDLFTLVQQYGGYTKVTTERKWREIYDALGRHANTITNPATSARKIYENLLLLYAKSKNKSSSEEEKDSIKIKNEPSDILNNKISQTKYDPIVNKPISLANITIPIETIEPSTNTVSTRPLPVESCVSPADTITKGSPTMTARNKYAPQAQSSPNRVPTPQTGGTTSFTLQAGEAFKLMIQKRRGRPSKDFRRQIEQLKTMNRKVEVEVFPPVGKRTRLPTWLNELNVDIINPRRKRKLSAAGNNAPRKYISSNSKIEISPLPKSEIPTVPPTGPSFVNNSNEILTCTSILKNDTPYPKAANGYAKVRKSPNEYASMVAINTDDKRPVENFTDSNKDNDRCEFAIKSVRSLAKPPHSSKRKRHSYVHYPSLPISAPQTVIAYGEHPQTVLPYSEPPQTVLAYNDYRPSHHGNSHTDRRNVAMYHGGLPVRDCMPPFQISDVRMKSPTSVNFDSKITGPNIRHIYYLNNEKRMYTSNNHRLSEENRIEDSNPHLEKVYLNHPSHSSSPNGESNHEARSPNVKSNYEAMRSLNGKSIYGPIKPSNGNSNHETVTHFPVAILPGQTDSKVSVGNLKFHNYKPPADTYILPTKGYKSIGGACNNGDENATISNPSFDYPIVLEEPQPKVYILPS